MTFSQRDFQTGQVVQKLNALNQSDQQLGEQIESVSSELNTMLDSVIGNLDNLFNVVDTKASATAVVQALSTKADLINGIIPAAQLPSFVDDVLEYESWNQFPSVGEAGKIYVDTTENKTWRWSGSTYVIIGGGGVALGETAATAYRGDRGKAAYDHSISQGNPHNATTSDIPEGNKLYFTEDTTEKRRIDIEYTESDKFARTSESVKTMFALINQTEDQINELWEKALAL